MEQKKENEVRISRLIILLILIFADNQFFLLKIYQPVHLVVF